MAPAYGIARARPRATGGRDELGWSPGHSSEDALLELLDGMRNGAGTPTPPLDSAAGGPGRIGEVLSGVGGRNEP